MHSGAFGCLRISGKYLTVSVKGATLPPLQIAVDADSRDAVRQHLAEHAHRLAVLRSMLGIAKVVVASSSPHHLLIASSSLPHRLLITSSSLPHRLLLASSSPPGCSLGLPSPPNALLITSLIARSRPGPRPAPRAASAAVLLRLHVEGDEELP